jgi:hypothetical protein
MRTENGEKQNKALSVSSQERREFIEEQVSSDLQLAFFILEECLDICGNQHVSQEDGQDGS